MTVNPWESSGSVPNDCIGVTGAGEFTADQHNIMHPGNSLKPSLAVKPGSAISVKNLREAVRIFN
ncbi:hypothetical protein HNQ08_003022 [Deinococcus humi]|uniref:Uncharacterized protein n=1 Tax=Deinococcus humi TaxID=662880 RepID=A0A7W8NFN6_9DEIO|nr:hypothetical protein [Deinococcus humi]